MKVDSINLQTYQNINALKSRRLQNIDPPDHPRQEKKLAGSSFAQLLSKQEINFLDENFSNTDDKNKAASKTHGRRIDLVA